MTVAAKGNWNGRLLRITQASENSDGSFDIWTKSDSGLISADLSIGVNLTLATPLAANSKVSYWGVKFYGKGFIVSKRTGEELNKRPEISVAKPFVSGRDITSIRRGL